MIAPLAVALEREAGSGLSRLPSQLDGEEMERQTRVHLRQRLGALRSLLSGREAHRAAFLTGDRRFAVRLLRDSFAWQVLVRFRSRTREWCLRLFAGMARA